jgi:alpha-tubulin suppressor-like RCC1 family protein
MDRNRVLAAGYYSAAALDGSGTMLVHGYAGGAIAGNNFIQVAVQRDKTYALRSDGTIAAGGAVPVDYQSLTDVAAISVNNGGGYGYAFALHSDGSASYFREHDSTPSASLLNGFATLPQPIKKIAAGRNESFAIYEDGTAIRFGSVPAYSSNLSSFSNIADIQLAYGTGSNHLNILLTTSGDVYIWGQHISSAMPTLVASNAIQISAGEGFVLALLNTGQVLGWGNNSYGRAQNGAGLTNVVEIAAGNEFSLARHVDGTLSGWGRSSYSYFSLSTVTAWSGLPGESAYTLSGVTALQDGTPVSAEIRIYEAETGLDIATIISSPVDGSYSIDLPRRLSAYLQCIYDTGHRPLVHGPITPPPEV